MGQDSIDRKANQAAVQGTARDLASSHCFRHRLVITGAVLLLGGLMIYLRIFALDSDAYPSLSWSSALLTDEGFYIHNARNLILYGHTHTDQFNNMLIMPVLHLIQVFVFSHWGVGAIQARAISVVMSLLGLPIFFWATDRSLGRVTAVYSTLFLGLDHINLLYNRLALMDTPAAFMLILVFSTWIEGHRAVGVKRSALFFVCGCVLGIAYSTRGLIAPLCLLTTGILCYRLVIAAGKNTEVALLKRQRLDVISHLCGLICLGLIYYVYWYHPNQPELVRINHYYSAQLLPKGMGALGHNLYLAILGDNRGMFPYLIRHSPIQCGLALIWLFTRFPSAASIPDPTHKQALPGMRDATGQETGLRSATLQYLQGWLLVIWTILLISNYTPSRYYVLFYPALAVLAAYTLSQWRDVKARLGEHPALSGALAGLFCYHLAQVLGMRSITDSARLPIHATRHIRTEIVQVLSYSMGIVAAIAGHERIKRGRHSSTQRARWISNVSQKAVPCVFLGVWAIINLGWTSNWITHLTYRQREADAWLGSHLPANSVLIGAVSPGLCLNNKLRAVSVIADLCNDHRPVESFAPAPRYILILDDRWRERWWDMHYPALVDKRRRVMVFDRILRSNFRVGVYPVKD